MKKSTKTSLQRRRFLGKIARTGAAAAAIGAVPTAVTGNIETPQTDVPEKAKSKGYQITRHVLDYYKTASI